MKGLSNLIDNIGDIETNPGPPRDPCGMCRKGVRVNQDGVACDACEQWYHCKCINMDKNTLHEIANNNSEWYCHMCTLPQISPDNSSNEIPDLVIDDDSDIGNNETDGAQENVNLFNMPTLVKGLSIAHLNTCSLLDKLEQVRLLLIDSKLDILAISESWLSNRIEDSEIYIDGYKSVESR